MIELLEPTPNFFVGCITHKNGKKENVHIGKLFLSSEDSLRFLEPVKEHANNMSPHTQHLWLRGMKVLGQFFGYLGLSRMPVSEEEWQELVDQCYVFCLTRTDTGGTLEYRARFWDKPLAQVFRMLRDTVSLIPIGLTLPTRKRFDDALPLQKTLLDSEPDAAVEQFVDKLLIGVSVSQTDPAYLEKTRDDLLKVRSLLSEGCLDWWRSIEAHYEYGQRILAGQNWPEVQRTIDGGRAEMSEGHTGRRLISKQQLVGGATEESLGRLLTALANEFPNESIHTVLTINDGLPRDSEVTVPDSAPRHPCVGIGAITRLNWMLGRLGPRDIAFALVFLTLRNPKFTPMSLADAIVTGKRDNSLFELRAQGLSFRLDKPRVRAMKYELLDDESIYVIRIILKMTSAARKRLKNDHAVDADRLFLIANTGRAQACAYDSAAYHLKRKNGAIWLMTYLPKLEATGLVTGSLSLNKIRATECVVEWFRTGSVTSASRKIGNTTRVAIKHYIPEALITAWNTRLIRRFQNLWICIAAAKEDFLLDVTDFHSEEQLHTFLVDMLSQHPGTSSTLAAELHRRFANIGEFEEISTSASMGSLVIPITANSLSLMYCYRDLAYQRGLSTSELDQPDAKSGLTPRAIVDLADLLNARLPIHQDPAITATHELAMRRVPALKLRCTWGDFALT